MTRPIGYYVHHHGDGHRQRATAVAAAGGGRVVLLGTSLAGRCGDVETIDLPDDRLGDRFDGSDGQRRPAALHYAPIDHDGVRRRTAIVTEWMARARPALIVVDVSVEIAMLARLAATPTVYVRLSGRRLDRPHFEAFRGAAGLLAPFHEQLDDDRTPSAIRRRTFYAPGIVAAAAPVSRALVDSDLVLGVTGRGGGPSDGEAWAAAARATPRLRWRVIGPCTVPRDRPDNLELRGWVDDPAAMIASAGVVVGAAGDGLVGSVIAARRPFLCIPEPRPFAEQISKADRLAALGAAIVRHEWPAEDEWPQLLTRAQTLDAEALAGLDAQDGASHAAAWIADMADHGSEFSRCSA